MVQSSGAKSITAQSKAAAVADLRDFVRIAEEMGDLVRVQGAEAPVCR